MNLLLEVVIMAILAIAPLINPYFLHQKLNLFELGLYLPGIDGLLHGAIPYRDFFYLRGPFELYLPAGLMHIFGMDIAVLSTYFYVGTILTVCVAVWMARMVIPSRIFLFCFIPVMVTRTFPRVVYTYWGGMRYFWGLLAIALAIRFFQTRRNGWIIFAAIITVIGGLTSSEIGVCAAVAIIVALAFFARSSLKIYIGAIIASVLPYLIYLHWQGALTEYVHMQVIVATQMTKTFVQADKVPSNPLELIQAMIWPGNKNFRQMTPVYTYIAFIVYLFWRQRTKKIDPIDAGVLAIAAYGFMIYATGFRNLWATTFEMSLQAEKIVLFYLLARSYLALRNDKNLLRWSYALLGLVIVSSVIFAGARVGKRFFGKLSDGRKEAIVPMHLNRLAHHYLPTAQAEDINKLAAFADSYIPSDEPVLMFPELGTMHFILNRPAPGRFASHTMSWIDDGWFKESMDRLKAHPPLFAIVNKTMPDYFAITYFPVTSNVVKFDTMTAFIKSNYVQVAETPNYFVYHLR